MYPHTSDGTKGPVADVACCALCDVLEIAVLARHVGVVICSRLFRGLAYGTHCCVERRVRQLGELPRVVAALATKKQE